MIFVDNILLGHLYALQEWGFITEYGDRPEIDTKTLIRVHGL